MSIFKWSEKYSVGVETLDAQHKKLIEIVDGLCQGMKGGFERSMLLNTLKSLAQYTKDHFEKEEAMMAAAGYPKLAQHKQLHAQLIQQVNQYITAFNQQDNRKLMELPTFLRSWLSKHILNEDTQYSECIKKSLAA